MTKQTTIKLYEHFNYYWKHNRLASLTSDDKYIKIMPAELKKEVLKKKKKGEIN